MDQRPPLAERLRHYTAVTAACALTTVVVLYAVLCAKLADDTPSDAYGTGSPPRGFGILAASTVVGALAAAVLWWYVVRGRRHRSALGRAAAVALALVALGPGWLGFSWMRGPQMDLFGYQVPDGGALEKPLGSWAFEHSSGAVIRVRADGVTAYNGEGRHGGGFRAPDGGAVCAMSDDAPSGTGLVTLTTADSECGNSLVAVRTESGEKRWTKDIPKLVGKPSAGGNLAVAATTDAVLAHDLDTGAELWRFPLPAGAVVSQVAAGPDRVLFLARTEGGSELSALDARTGSRSWQALLPDGYGAPGIVSASPAAAVADGRLLLFDETGRPRTDPEPPFHLGPDTARLVVGDVLYAAVPEREKRELLAAYSLKDGRRLWTRAFEGDWQVRAVAVGRNDRIAVVTQGAYTHLWHLDPGTGKPGGESTVLRDLPLGTSFALYGRTFVNLDAGGRLPPIFDVRPAFGW
ncbi:outer membrane protein assembly factor BamB family protein [Streptomyces sp. NBC_01205]|uniref:outer membrane protein assembly factor BamB family protein n=1 Tax=Streptomyces sp. NBC_01205 TaxID=2903771 RepID=UPI002E1572C4|nr:PQQ-binding-like beta-propeller repeat protein [Streptomyces sp. NBC_01205]